MKNILSYEKSIINYWDLRNSFNPIVLYNQLEAFTEFAEMHCVPLPLIISDQQTGKKYKAEYLIKQFWLDVLSIAEWENGADVADTFNGIMSSFAKKMQDLSSTNQDTEGSEDIFNSFKKEAADCCINEKLKYIENMCCNDKQYRKYICLLAVCELAEIDVLKTEESIWKDKESEKNKTSTNSISDFTYDKEAKLPAGNEVFKYWYHDSDTFDSERIIRTVKIEAVGSSNRYAVLKIELYSETDESCVKKMTLKKGEWVYCNVINGKIIKIFPLISLSDDMCLLRKSYSETDIMVFSPEAESWSFNAEDVSSFIAAKRKDGFLMVKDGKVISKFYKAAEDYLTKLQLDMVAMPVVEVNIEDDGYELLLENGTVVSDNSKYERAGVISLTPEGRKPFTQLIGKTRCFEAAVSKSRGSVALLTDNPKREDIMFQSDSKEFRIYDQHDCIEVVL